MKVIRWFKNLSTSEKYLIYSLIFLLIMLALTWSRVIEGFLDGLRKLGLIGS
jgi:hypothetical protein